ncbi:MAG: hypothetical protein LIP23_08005 [Planctomycetes bacterium]|nr:hypothetical protein [Planctomycetota bacterium]
MANDSEISLETRLAEVEAREKAVAEKERALKAKGLHFNIYENLSASPKAVDAVIIACIAAIALLVGLGTYFGKFG